jgi:predicted HTH transcriptional regulator
MELPNNIDDLNQLIKNEVQENIHLDYKDSRAIDSKKRHDIAKDVSAFANSDGGILIYGIREEDHLPIALDEGVDHTKYSREWLEEVITSNITPRIDDLKIIQIPVSTSRSWFVVKVPKSYRAPHQEQYSKRYYKRFNFISERMEDYEINDVRRDLPPLLVPITIRDSARFLTLLAA